MGACTFVTEEAGKDLQQAYRRAQEQARFMYGHDPYNGTISTCDLIGEGDFDGEAFTQEDGRTRRTPELQEFLNAAFDRIDKRECEGLRIAAGRYLFYGWAAE
jgi:hypothetical protein